MNKEERLFSTLVEAVQLLAADYEAQVAALPAYAAVPDELALIYHDAYLLVDQMADAGQLTEKHLAKLRELDEEMDAMSGAENTDRWTLDALRSDPWWERMRLLAGDALRSLNVPRQRPALGHMTDVESTRR